LIASNNSQRRKASPPQLALAWVLHQGNDIVPIAGTKRAVYLEENLAAADVHLSPQELGRINHTIPQPSGERYDPAAGSVYVNGGSGSVVCVHADGTIREVAAELQWPNGMALLADDRILVVADSHAEQLLAFDVDDDGMLSDRRVWAELEHAPDGICADADGAVWVASVPGEHCIRVAEGGEVLSTVTADRGCFACMLGGEDGRTLFIAAAQWRGMEAAMNEGPGLTGQLLAAPDQPAPHAGRP
jgi:sugar lactone lactonase YvrE